MTLSARQTHIKKQKHNIHGWINLDKPYDMTSTQAVNAIKRLLSPAKIGHAGTLDPLATGVLPLALGEATKTVQYMMDSIKIYQFTVSFGAQTDTDDIEGDIIAHSDHRPDNDEIIRVLPHYTGIISQLPPRFSAIKINGERAYDLARAGEQVELAPRNVLIQRFELLARPDMDQAIFEVECGKGTYVRSLARDIAKELGTYGHISALRRIRVGSFTADTAISLDELSQYAIDNALSSQEEWLDPVERALDDIPAVTLDQVQARRLQHGQSCFVAETAFSHHTGHIQADGQEVYQARHAGKLLAIVSRKQRSVTPVRLFHFNK